MSEYGEQIDENTVRFRRVLPGPIERIWAWITEEDKRRLWLAAGETELREGGKAELFFDNSTLTTPDDAPPEKYKDYCGETKFVGEVLEADPPRLIRFTWPESNGEVSEVVFELEEQGGKVVFTLTHKKLATRKDLIGVSGGWHTHLDILAAKLSQADPGPFWSKIVRLEAIYEERIKA